MDGSSTPPQPTVWPTPEPQGQQPPPMGGSSTQLQTPEPRGQQQPDMGMGFHDELSVLQRAVVKHEEQMDTLTRLVENLRTVLDRLENSMHALQSSVEQNAGKIAEQPGASWSSAHGGLGAGGNEYLLRLTTA